MAETITTRSERVIAPDQYVDYITENVDLGDEESVLESAEQLSALNNNKKFVLEILNNELTRDPNDVSGAFYSAHSFVVANGNPKKGGASFTVRVNVWPPVPHSALAVARRRAVNQVYAYEYPHDHNFNFLTAGYWGSGYETIIYEYDRQTLQGIPGEASRLRFLERTWLSEGKLMYYRRCKDVHIQLPPAEPSMSLNLLIGLEREVDIEQYNFDIEQDRIASYIPSSRISEKAAIIDCLAELGDDNSVDLLFTVLSSHPVRRLRRSALLALARLKPFDIDAIKSLGSRDTDLWVRDAAISLEH